MNALLCILVSMTALLTFSQNAEARAYDTTKLKCSEARGLLARAGELTLYSGPDIFNRYSAKSGIAVALVPTRDNSLCRIGYVLSAPEGLENTGEYVVRISQPRTCEHGQRILNNPDQMQKDHDAVPHYRVCVKGRWVAERREYEAAGISVIGTGGKN